MGFELIIQILCRLSGYHTEERLGYTVKICVVKQRSFVE